jgi:hypothetical protein
MMGSFVVAVTAVLLHRPLEVAMAPVYRGA